MEFLSRSALRVRSLSRRGPVLFPRRWKHERQTARVPRLSVGSYPEPSRP